MDGSGQLLWHERTVLNHCIQISNSHLRKHQQREAREVRVEDFRTLLLAASLTHFRLSSISLESASD